MKNFSELHILLAEDRLNMRKIIRTILLGLGIRHVTEAENGEQALQLLGDGNKFIGPGKRGFDLVIADWVMPKMTGIELLQQVRSTEFLRDLPFLMITAEHDSDKVINALKHGVTDYIVKPFPAKLLEEKILNVLHRL